MKVNEEFITAYIYNKDELAHKGWKCSMTDREALRQYLDQVGMDSLASVNGDFAGAMSASASRWILFRDHMGIVPLYYYLKGSDLFFASDIRDLCARDIDLSVNEEWLYLETRAANSETPVSTEFRYIKAVRPGSWCEFSFDKGTWQIKEHIYWQPGMQKVRMESDEAYIKEMRRLVEDSVRIRLASVDGVVGAELSGGLDSGVIDILIAREGRDTCFVSWSENYEKIPMQPVDERQVVEDICEQEGRTFAFINEEDPAMFDLYKRRMPAFINTLPISQTSRIVQKAGGSVVFTGHGGDEGVSHRSNMTELWYHKEYGAFFRETWQNNKGKSLKPLRFLNQVIRGLFFELPEWKKSWNCEERDIKMCLNPAFAEEMERKYPEFPQMLFGIDPVRYILQGGSRSRMDNCYIQGKDYGVRYVFPFLDYRVIDFAVSIPRRMYHHNGQNRYIYREAFKDLMPQSLRDVNYKDFPSTRQLREQQNEQMEDEQKSADTCSQGGQTGEARKTEQEIHDAYNEYIQMILDRLDWNRWGRYLDRGACEQVLWKLFPPTTEDENLRAHSLSSFLYQCSLIQNLQDHH